MIIRFPIYHSHTLTPPDPISLAFPFHLSPFLSSLIFNSQRIPIHSHTHENQLYVCMHKHSTAFLFRFPHTHMGPFSVFLFLFLVLFFFAWEERHTHTHWGLGDCAGFGWVGWVGWTFLFVFYLLYVPWYLGTLLENRGVRSEDITVSMLGNAKKT